MPEDKAISGWTKKWVTEIQLSTKEKNPEVLDRVETMHFIRELKKPLH